MSPMPAPVIAALTGFPRVSGDEPAIAAECESQALFSPRERG
mgnify:CR=1 FL=1